MASARCCDKDFHPQPTAQNTASGLKLTYNIKFFKDGVHKLRVPHTEEVVRDTAWLVVGYMRVDAGSANGET